MKTDNTLKVVTSQKFTFEPELVKVWVSNQITFLKPYLAFVAVLYIGALVPVLQQPGHVVSLNDFLPSSSVITASALYIVNAVFDALRKYTAKVDVIVEK
jgi:hypothetical protein